MLIACWSAKGGSGTTVVSVALAVLLARRSPGGSVLADLAGDMPAALGRPDPPGPGLAEWLAAGAEVPADGLERLAIEVVPGLRLLARGDGHLERGGDGVRLAAALNTLRPSPSGIVPIVVADCGTAPAGPALDIVAEASVSLLVTRACYLSLRRAVAAPVRPSGVILVAEEGRSLGAADVEDVLGVPVRAVVRCEPAVARAVDAGILATRVPRSLERALRRAA